MAESLGKQAGAVVQVKSGCSLRQEMLTRSQCVEPSCCWHSRGSPTSHATCNIRPPRYFGSATKRSTDPACNKSMRCRTLLHMSQREFASQHDFGFIYLPSFAHSYSVTKSPEDKRQALAAAEVRQTWQPYCGSRKNTLSAPLPGWQGKL